ncbi:MAG: ATP-binding cassette domain-containing protein, partial [Tissierellales bacterium]|nr:ATP-binding cassette domain-containing protein [Tissierellales bacterium]
EIHCLVGENGAGKSTLMKILSGVYPYGSYEGDIVLNGEIQKFHSIQDSEKAGIAIIYQELALVPEMTVYENIYLGHEIRNGINIDWNETIVQSKKMLEKVRLNINPEMKVKYLGVGKMQLVEIAKAFSKDVKLLILDEPTAALNDDDADNLLNLLVGLKNEGITSIMVSHKLKEVIKVADTVTVLRDGKTICSLDAHKDEVSEPVLIKHMVGREITDVFPKRKVKNVGDVIFEVKNLNAYDPTTSKQILKDVNIKARSGEVVGIAGLMGAGRTELAYSIFGNPKGYRVNGEIYVEGKLMNFKNPSDAIGAGVAYVTEDRKGEGLILIQDVKSNITLSNLREIANNWIIDDNKEITVADEYKISLNIKTPSIEQKVQNLSGGNQQKVSLAKWLFTKPKILILDEPTRGIDVGAKFEIYNIINDLVSQGMCILMISSELPEILGMSDRVYIMSQGRITGELPIEEASQDKIMEFATV